MNGVRFGYDLCGFQMVLFEVRVIWLLPVWVARGFCEVCVMRAGFRRLSVNRARLGCYVCGF